jgi:inner membrane protein
MIPNEVAPLWSIELHRDAKEGDHADYLVHRDSGDGRVERLWSMLTGG